MNYTEEQILEKSKKILKDLQKEFYNEVNIENTRFQKDRPIRGNEKKTIPCWITSVDEPIFDTSEFLTISDETGEPLYFQNSHKVIEIEKDKNGNYKWKE
jgi:hypothetical protein